MGVCRLGHGVFEVMAPVDLGLTSVGRFDSVDSVISVNDAK
jgi:hypothetical protein